jgi:hypothetical protein
VKGECCTKWIVETLILNDLPARFMIGRSTMSGVHSSILRLVAVVLPWVAVEVDLPLDLEVVIPLEIPTVLQLRLLDLGFPTL